MASWQKIEDDAPDFAGRVRRRFELGTNKTIATLRADGSPRISATELAFDDGEITLGMMGDSMKLLDVRRDPRVAIHSPTIEPPQDPNDPDWLGDAKLAGTLLDAAPLDEKISPGAGSFKVDITEVTLTYVGIPADHLVIESWHSGRGWQRRTRA
jgi:Pyridoxamine 5'-phosphate oxidase